MSDAVPLLIRQLSVGNLEAVSLELMPGEVVCLSGRSGSGKTRLLRAVADLESHQGEVCLGRQLQQSMAASRWRQRVTLVPSESQWWADRVGDHFPCDMSEGLQTLGFGPETMDWGISRLSSGEKQRLALLRSFCHGPSALLLDEPTANLDPALTAITERWLVGQVRRQRMPVLWVAHDPGQIDRVADRHYQIQGNRLEQV